MFNVCTCIGRKCVEEAIRQIVEELGYSGGGDTKRTSFPPRRILVTGDRRGHWLLGGGWHRLGGCGRFRSYGEVWCILAAAGSERQRHTRCAQHECPATGSERYVLHVFDP